MDQAVDPQANAATERQGWVRLPLFLLFLCVLLATLFVHASDYMPFLCDDALIAFCYSKNLLNGEGLAWSDGKPVEGYSNLLWILLVAAMGGFGFELITGARILGFLCVSAAVTAILFHYFSRRPGGMLSAFTGSLVIVLSGSVAGWTIGGMEQPLVLVLLAGALISGFRLVDIDTPTARNTLWPSIFLALLCLARSEGPLFTIAAVLALFMARGIKKSTFKLAVKLASLPVLCYLSQLCFRLLYYGEWVPNTALVKITMSSHHIHTGIIYILGGFVSSLPLSAITLPIMVLLLIKRNTRGRAILLLLSGLLWLIYIVSVGGDIFHGWRGHIPLILITALLLCEFFVLISRSVSSKKLVTVLILAIFLLLTWHTHRQYYDKENLLIRANRLVWKGKAMGEMLRRGFHETRPTLAVTAAGCIPYWSELPCIDMLGLNDYYLPRHPPENHGRGWIGHELGDAEYILDRRPDMILFGTRGRPVSVLPIYRPMLQMPRFKENYTPIIFAKTPPNKFRSKIWVNRNSPKIGPRISDNEIVVPAYLLNANPSTTTNLNAQGKFVVRIAPNDSAGITDLSVPPGTWKIETLPSRKCCELEIRRMPFPNCLESKTGGASCRESAHASPPACIVLAGDQPACLDVWISNPGPETVELQALTLVAMDG